jgi:hypothetical protein
MNEIDTQDQYFLIEYKDKIANDTIIAYYPINK